MKYIFLAAAFMLATIASANADTTCAVNSPDGELNVRELTQNGPGKVTDTLKNGYGTREDINHLFIALARALGIEARLAMAGVKDSVFDFQASVAVYEAAFRTYGIDLERLSPQ